MNSRRAVFIALVIAVGLYVWPVDEPQAPPPTAEPVAAVVKSVTAAPVPIHRVDAAVPSVVAAQPVPGLFQEGFCAPEGDETIKTTRVLSTLLSAELTRRQTNADPSDDPEETRLLIESFEPFDARTQKDHLAAARQVADRLTNSPWPQLVVALLAKSLHLQEVELAALRRAHPFLPHDPALGLAIALATRTSPDLDEPIAGLDDSLAVDSTPGLARIRARLEVQRDIQRGYLKRSRGKITLLWPAESLTYVQVGDLLALVDQALEEATALIGAGPPPALTVVVYPGRSELLAVSCVPSWAGGLYDGVLRLIASNDALGVRPKTVLHETLHARLTPYAPNAPKWFHEGVAQSFAKEADEVRGQWRLMVRNKVWIPFESLDGTFGVLSANDAHLAYAQSLALVELVRETCGTNALGDAVKAFQSGATTSAALEKACQHEVTGAQLLAYLERRLSAPEP